MKIEKQMQTDVNKIDDELIIKACSKMDIFELRQYARIVGLINAEDFTRAELVENILDIENGRKPMANKTDIANHIEFCDAQNLDNFDTREALYAENQKLKNALKHMAQIIKNCLE